MSTEIPPGLPERLRICVKLAGSGDALATKAGVPRRTLENYLSGESEPKISRIVEIADAVGVNLEWLATGRGSMTEMVSGSFDDPIPPELGPGERMNPFRAFRSASRFGDQESAPPPQADEDLMSRIGELISGLHREMGITLAPNQLFRLTARWHNDVMATRPSESDIPAMLRLLEILLRAELREARDKPGTGKRSA